ncbi:hypothetical protein [[Eubacterium] cellulosolvens]
MGSNKDDEKKRLEKLEKKRLKQQYKLEKKRLEAQAKVGQHQTPVHAGEKGYESTETRKTRARVRYEEPKKVPWYKDPVWLRTIAAVASLIVMIIALIISLYR